jgi:hypothetical protein
MLSDYRLLSFSVPQPERTKEKTPKYVPPIKTGSYIFKNTVKLISINSAVVEKYLGIHNLSDYKLRKVKQSLEAIIPIDLEALCFKEVPAECISL